MNERLRALAAKQAGVVTRGQALVHGYTDEQIAGLLRTGEWTRLRRGVLAETATLSGDAIACHAAEATAGQLSIKRRTVVSHDSALLLYGVALLRPPQRVSLTAASGSAARYRGLDVACGDLPDAHVEVDRRHGMELVTAARGLVDVARTRPFLDAVVAADSALRLLRTDKAAVQGVIDDCREWPEVLRAHRVLDFADGRAESVLETASRVFFAQCDIELPEPQVWIETPDLGPARVDFYWRSWRLIGEADGKLKYGRAEDLWAEKRRQEALEELGFVVVRWGWDDIFVHPRRTEARIRAAMSRSARTQRIRLTG
jgi:hypothetical protein